MSKLHKYHNYNMISIEGIPGAGKSTIIEAMSKDSRFKDLHFITEEVDAWKAVSQLSSSGEPESLFDLYYNKKDRWSFTFQVMALSTCVQSTISALDNVEDKVSILSERSIESNMLFAENNYESGDMNNIEWNIYKYMYSITTHRISHLSIFNIFLKIQPKLAYFRVLKRARPGESLSLADLIKLDYKHDEWISTKPESATINVDSNSTTELLVDEIFNILKKRFVYLVD